MKLLLALFAIVVAAIVVVPMAFGRTAPDVNSPTDTMSTGQPSGPSSIGYADVTATFTIRQAGDCFDSGSGFTGCKLAATIGNGFVAEEHLTAPTGPATFYSFPSATIATQCTGKVKMTVSGPGASATAETEVNFPIDSQPAFHFGHLYFSAKGYHTVTLVLFVRGCYAYVDAEDTIASVQRAINFDGEADI